MSAHRTQLADGRWHFQHGPMDIVLGASGSPAVVARAHEDAWTRFSVILDELVQELALLRRPVQGPCPLRGPIARRMWQACQPYQSAFITPMAAVAGSVAQELIASYDHEGLTRAWINNGGDIALHLAPGESARIGLYADIARLDGHELRGGIRTDGQFKVSSWLPVRGVATSGWRGRSFSMGIADSVTVLARTASEADAAATVIANAVDVPDARILRRPACELKDDSDLGSLPVTVDVPALDAAQVRRALQAGLLRAQALRAAGLIWSAVLVCQNQVISTDTSGFTALAPQPVSRQHGSVFA
ncbi:UPF0280 family protein [Polaromonas sp.]|uniref:UPF0280 family protein n=1 Tax=Polaromonas sp. TaxID=1869339 RepID=UPI00273054CE|nr:UPF0280 family protein [Polaromonas sp.]MDP1741406.1 UPF0280 family protein [Polaromonas sp.]